jgi:hypothetical protein
LQLGNLDRRVNIQSATRLLGPSSCSIFLWLLTEVLETQRKIGGLCFGTRPAKAGPNSYRLGLAKPIEPSLERKKRAWMLGMPWSFRPENISHQPISSSLLTSARIELLAVVFPGAGGYCCCYLPTAAARRTGTVPGVVVTPHQPRVRVGESPVDDRSCSVTTTDGSITTLWSIRRSSGPAKRPLNSPPFIKADTNSTYTRKSFFGEGERRCAILYLTSNATLQCS